MDAAASGPSGPPAHRATGPERVPHTGTPAAPHLEVVAVTRSPAGAVTAAAETHRFAEPVGEFDEPTWVRYDPWVWTTRIEDARGDRFATPLAWPE